MMMRRHTVCLLVLALLASVHAARLFGEVPPPDLSKPPDPAAMATLARSGKLPEFEKVLRKMMADSWKPAQQGKGGSCSSPSFAAWIDLWRWLDHICTDEVAMAAEWAVRHCFLESRGGSQVGNAAESEVTISPRMVIIPPGASSDERTGTGSERVARMFAADPSLLTAVLGRLVPPPCEVGKGALADRLDPEFLAVTVSDPLFLRAWSEAFSDADFAPKALRNLESIWKCNRADWKEFLPLAIAISLVTDQKPPDFWPHQQVASTEVPRREIPAEEQFDLWVKAARGGKLSRSPSLLTARELMFVVDAPLDPSEFAWVRDTTSLTSRDPGRSYESIRYDTARTSAKLLDWPHGSYRLARIREFGGICVDQAYYAAMLAKAVGIPSLFFSGYGKDGGHAWLGYMKGPQLWDFTVGRYGDRNYAAGFALDPQTWEQISDHDLGFFLRPAGGSSTSRDSARRDLAIAALFRSKGDASGEERALQSAIEVWPENPSFWNAMESLLSRTKASRDRLTAHHQAATRQFERFPNVRHKHREALIRIALDSGDVDGAGAIALQSFNENRSASTVTRPDLAARTAWLLVEARLTSGDVELAAAEAERWLAMIGGDGGGELISRVVSPLAEALIRSGKTGSARSFLSRACRLLNPSGGSIVAQELLQLWEKAGGDPKNPEFVKLR